MWNKGEVGGKKGNWKGWKEVLKKGKDEKVVKDCERAQVDTTERKEKELSIQICLLPGETDQNH